MPFAFRWRRAPLLSLLLGAVLAGACGVDDYKFVPDDEIDAGEVPDAGPPPPATPTVCGSDADCAGLAATTVCDMRSGYCVECLPEREEELNRCGEGTYCRDDNKCGVGCESDLDCRGITCDVATHTCTGCVADGDCAPGTVCSAAVCVPGCAADDTCPAGFSCCGGTCKNPNTDATSCGACDDACDVTGQCINGVCGPGPCEPGLGECNGNAADGCETDLVDNPSNCGRCRAVCASGMCSGGTCTSTECPDGYADCNQLESDLCEASLSTVTDCLMCGKACSAENGDPSCTSRGCVIECDDGFGDCDEDADTGCEVDFADDVENCGGCGVVCENENGDTECVDGECVPSCDEGFDDCDGDPENGCETDLTTALGDCGACGEECDPPNATGMCVGGVCEAGCADGFQDCNGRIEDGCEADLSSPETCGDCSNVCNANGGTAICNDDGTCGITCNTGSADCINGALDGCETNTNLSVLHCGMCGRACPSALGTPACNDGVCGISTCTDPNRECDGNDATVCETNVTNDPENCDGCGMTCFYPNGTGICVNRGCVLDECDSGFSDCTAALGCETRLGTLDNCRTCGEACRNDHGTTSCETNGCVPSCQVGWGDCDGNRNNGCETELNTLVNCGACGRTCSTAHGTPTCATGSCAVSRCDTGWDNCDGQVSNGCERSLTTLTDCGGCNVACNLPRASESCGTGVCTLTTCDSGWRDCSAMQAGCETQLGTLTDCLGCGDACTNTHGTTSCNAMTGCQPTCDTGWKSCDGNPRNGCERNIRSLTDCGDCDVDCDLANAAESCSMGTCMLGACAGGFGNCDMNPATGCETPLGTVTNCMSCGNTCSNAHGTFSCNAASGCQFTCSAGWDSCDANAANGCETSTRTLTNCNVCGAMCDIPNSNETCVNGTCESTTCATGFAECVAGAPSCETPLGTVTNCRSCNEACTNAHGGTTCSMTTGCSPTCDAGWKSCDSIADNGCERDIRTLTSCGDCDVPCSFLNAAASCTTGTCTMGACNSGFSDCTATAGCETQLGTASNCASCGNACTNAHGSNGCTGMPGSFDCSPVCEAGWLSCNMNPDDGCETSVTTTMNCGSCGNVCSFPNAGAACTNGTCVPTGCSAGFADCTAAAGCETALGTTSNCAACGNACTNTHGTTACTGMPGTYDCSPTCSGFWRSCNGNPDDGCETSIETLTDCGACGAPCNLANASETCPSGVCTLGTCTAGFGNCDAQAGNGCETTLGNVTHCNACGNTCTNSHGTTSCTGSAGAYDCAPVCDANWGSCNSNPDDGCETDLTTTTNCGQCGRACGGTTPFCVQTSGAYNCAASLSISLVNSNARGSNTSSAALDVPHTLQTAVNNFRLVAALVASDGNSQSTARPTAITYNGQAMTLRREVWSGNRVLASIFTISDASLPGPSATPYTLRITGAEFGKIVNIYELRGVDQTNPVAAVGGTSGVNCGGDDPSDSVSTSVANTFMLTTVATFGTDAGTATTGQTQTYSFTNGAMGYKAGHKANYASASLITWDMTNCNASAHSLATLRPAGAP